MTIEELLKPRYKVINEYPFSLHKLGIIYECPYYYMNIDKGKAWIDFHKQFPAIFQELKWWQEREIEDLPKYLKIEDAIRKVVKWDLGLATVFVTNGLSLKPRGNRINIYTPATEEEYLQFTNHNEVIK